MRFFKEKLPSTQTNSTTKQIHMGDSVIASLDDSTTTIQTTGLHTCVALSLYNAEKNTALMTHYANTTSINATLPMLLSVFLDKADCNDSLVCHISGGRCDNRESIEMHTLLLKTVKKMMPSTHVMILRLSGPFSLTDRVTTSLSVDLATGKSTVAIDKKTSKKDKTYRVNSVILSYK